MVVPGIISRGEKGAIQDTSVIDSIITNMHKETQIGKIVIMPYIFANSNMTFLNQNLALFTYYFFTFISLYYYLYNLLRHGRE